MTLPDSGAQLVDLGDYRLNVVVVGSGGPPLLVVHGGMGYGHSGFRPWLDDLAVGNTVIYVDLPGNAGSDTPADFDEWNTVERLSGDLHRLKEAMGIASWSVLGHSFGGFVVQSYALDYPDDIDALVISCSTSEANLEAAYRRAEELAETPEQAAEIRDALMSPRVSDAEYEEVSTRVLSVYFADKSRVAISTRPKGIGRAAAHNATLRIWDNSVLISRVPELAKLPTLVLGASQDWTFPVEVGARRTHDLIEGSTYHEFQRSGHFPYVEQHDEFIRVVGGWLAEQDRGAAAAATADAGADR